MSAVTETCGELSGMSQRPGTRTIYIDCSRTSKTSAQTGIQRVVRNVVRYAAEAGARHGYSVKVVALEAGEFAEVPPNVVLSPRPLAAGGAARLVQMVLSLIDETREALTALSSSPAWNDFVNAPRRRFGLAWCVCLPVSALLAIPRKLKRRRDVNSGPARHPLASGDRTGDILLLPDSTWDVPDDVWAAAARFRLRGGYVVALIYDLIPLTHPQYCLASFVGRFSQWILESVSSVDLYICISRSTEETLKAFLEKVSAAEGGERAHPQTGFFHLGSDLDLAESVGLPSEAATKIIADGVPVFLVVGTLEPRKNLAFVLDAFDAIWQENHRVKLVLVGHRAWKARDVLSRLRRHALRDRYLFRLRGASDTDLDYLYRHSTALIFASTVEGFGLPVVEALQRGLPVLCSDIPILREVAGRKARFFDLNAPDELIAAVREMATYQSQGAPLRTSFSWLSWRESCDSLIRTVVTAHQEFLSARIGVLRR